MCMQLLVRDFMSDVIIGMHWTYVRILLTLHNLEFVIFNLPSMRKI